MGLGILEVLLRNGNNIECHELCGRVSSLSGIHVPNGELELKTDLRRDWFGCELVTEAEPNVFHLPVRIQMREPATVNDFLEQMNAAVIRDVDILHFAWHKRTTVPLQNRAVIAGTCRYAFKVSGGQSVARRG